MITKKEFCNIIIDNYCFSERIDRNKLQDADVYKSSWLAIAMEYMNMIKSDEVKDYCKTRNGMLFSSIPHSLVKVLTIRDILELLPQSSDY